MVVPVLYAQCTVFRPIVQRIDGYPYLLRHENTLKPPHIDLMIPLPQ